MRIAAPAPKNAPAGSIAFAAAAAIKPRPRTAKIRPAAFAPPALRRAGAVSARMVPASKLRSEIRARPRSVHQMQAIAAITRPGGPREERDRRHVQRQHGRAHGARPPGSQARHHGGAVADRACHADDAADDGEEQPFGGKQPADARRAQPDGAQQADLARALLDPQPEEERGQHECRRDEEKAEVDEVLAEVRRPARGVQRFGPGCPHGESHARRVELGSERRFEPLTRSRKRLAAGQNPERCLIAVASASRARGRRRTE